MLDKKRPYGTVSGQVDGYPGAKYFQDDRYYGTKGHEINPDAPDAAMPAVTNDAPSKPREGEPLPGAATVAPSSPDGLDALHWTELKRRVEAAGGVWTNKAEAIEFLS